VNRRAIFARQTREDVFHERKLMSAQRWDMGPKGQHIELGIAENNLFLLLGALGLSHSLFGERLLPIGTLYDPFIARGLDSLNYACYQDARFIVAATPSGITLAPEGGAHQSVGTPLIADALTSTGHLDVAYRLLLQRRCPSWLYPVSMGATTIWERWDSMLPDGTINPGQMTSFNHYAFGSVADWMHRRLAGLAPAAPGYRKITIAPVVPDGLDWCEASYDSGYGPIKVRWERSGDEVKLTASIPPGVTADVRLPDGTEQQASHGDHEWRAVPKTKEEA
jgi:hypothetical protein